MILVCLTYQICISSRRRFLPEVWRSCQVNKKHFRNCLSGQGSKYYCSLIKFRTWKLGEFAVFLFAKMFLAFKKKKVKLEPNWITVPSVILIKRKKFRDMFHHTQACVHIKHIKNIVKQIL